MPYTPDRVVAIGTPLSADGDATGAGRKSGRHEPGDSIQTGYADNRSLSARRYARRFSHRLRTQLRRQQQEWDFRTPEGHFVIESVEDTSLWPRDSTRQETPGEIYGPRFFRLKTPGFTGIGIHGTANPQVIPGRITMGCIRLSNEDLKAFSRLVDVDTRVDILPDKGRERGSLSKLARDDDY